MVQRVDLAIATVDTTCVEVVVGNPIKVVTEGDENATTDAVEFVVIGWGKKTPFWRGTGRIGLSALPTGLPTPGNVLCLGVDAYIEDLVYAADHNLVFSTDPVPAK